MLKTIDYRSVEIVALVSSFYIGTWSIRYGVQPDNIDTLARAPLVSCED